MLAAGQRLGAYEVVSLIGVGGMGEVYRARDIRLDRDVALKVLAPALSDAAHVERFQREARAIAALSHPNIVALFDVGDGPPAFFVTELLEGETLRARLQRSALPVPEAVTIVIQVLGALAAAHDRGVVHRDVKPENVFLTRNGPVKVLDFGLAKTLEPVRSGPADLASTRMSATFAGTVVGPLGYMAPEQVRGMPVDHRADIFAVGALLYEMLTGRRAFNGNSQADVVSAILREEPNPLGDRSIPAGLGRAIRRCLAKDPAGRYGSARDLQRDVERVNADAHAGAAEHSIAVLPFTNLSGDPENQYFGDGLAEDLINALTRLPGLRVASRTSSFRFGGREADVGEIVQALKVATVLEGSVRRAGQRLRVTAQLINSADGYHLWSERYDRQIADVFDIQDEIVCAIVKAVAPALSGDARTVVTRPTDNLEAYELYLKGRHYWNERLPSTLKIAVQCFERVIALDPDYALAYCGMSDAYAIYRAYAWFPAAQTQPRALDAVTRAAQLAPTLPQVNFSRALYAFYFDPNWRAARAYLQQTVQAEPRNASARGYLGIVNAIDGRPDEALADLTAARELEPFSPFIHFLVGVTYTILRRCAEAETTAREALALDPDSLVAMWGLSIALCGLRRTTEAVSVASRAVAKSRAPFGIGVLALACGLDGRADEVTQLRGELAARASRGEYVTPVADLQAAVGLNDLSAIRAALRACVDDRTPPLTLLATCGPWFAELRADPEVDGLLRRLY